MPTVQQTRAGGGSQFTGASSTTGLFEFGDTGSQWVQVRIKSVIFYTGGAITAWDLNFVDPDGNVSLWQTGTSTNFALADGTQGIIVLPIADTTNVSWSLSFVSDTMAAAGTITVDYDFVSMQ
jgi:hypothetical protein